MAGNRKTRRRAVVLGIAAAVTLGLVSFGSVTTVYAEQRAESAAASKIRDAIVAKAVAENRKSDTHDGGNNYYPKRYQLANVVRPAAWCGIFVNYVWAKGGATKRPSMRGSGVDQGHWATYWQKWGKANKRWKPISKRNPAKGDAIVYGSYPASRHVGLVVAVKRNSKGQVTHVKTVEGNLSNTVTSPTYNGSTWRPISKLTGGGAKATGFVSPVAL